MNKRLWSALLLSWFMSVFLASNCLAQDAASIVHVGDSMPSFSLTSSAGTIHSSDLKGKVVLINFFATWCPPCIQELPHVKKRIADEYSGHKDFALLVVGREHSLKEMEKFKANKFDLPFYPDPQRAVYAKFALNTIPRNYIVDRSGKIIYASSGFAADEFEKMLQVLERALDN